MQRAKALNPGVVKHWFHDVVRNCIVNKNIDPDCIWAMDETGVPQTYSGRERVIGIRGTKTQHKAGGNEHGENVTAIITICGNGSATKPTLIFRGANFQRCWINNNVAGASYVST